jgi:hypothetical protein
MDVHPSFQIRYLLQTSVRHMLYLEIHLAVSPKLLSLRSSRPQSVPPWQYRLARERKAVHIFCSSSLLFEHSCTISLRSFEAHLANR